MANAVANPVQVHTIAARHDTDANAEAFAANANEILHVLMLLLML